MDASKRNRKKVGREDITPELVEEATMEIIKESIKILKDYNLKGVVTNVEVGLLPIHRKKIPSEEAYEFIYNDLFSLLINLKE